jgi:hypothetical protein
MTLRTRTALLALAFAGALALPAAAQEAAFLAELSGATQVPLVATRGHGHGRRDSRRRGNDRLVDDHLRRLFWATRSPLTFAALPRSRRPRHR